MITTPYSVMTYDKPSRCPSSWTPEHRMNARRRVTGRTYDEPSAPAYGIVFGISRSRPAARGSRAAVKIKRHPLSLWTLEQWMGHAKRNPLFSKDLWPSYPLSKLLDTGSPDGSRNLLYP